MVGDALAVTAAFLLARSLSGRARQQAPGQQLLIGALYAGGASLIVKSCFLVWHNRDPAAMLTLFSESLLVSLITPLFLYGWTGGSLLRPADAGFRPGGRLQQRELQALLALVMVLSGLGDIRIGPTVLREILVRCVLIVVAYAMGAGWAAGAGVLLGLLTGDFQEMLPRAGFYAGTGFFAGVLGGFGRIGVMAGFFLSSLLFSVFYGDTRDLSGHLLASLLTAGLFFLASPLIDRQLGRTKTRTAPEQPLQAEIGFSQRPKSNEVCCGDSFAVVHQSPEHLLLTVSDGIGAGVNAMRESRIVVKLLEQLMGNGIDPEAAAGIVNTALYLRGGEESAATIDMAAVDLKNRYVDFLKAGAPPSFIKRDRGVEMIRSSCWPAGILDRVEAEVQRRQVLPGDILVMATDGVTEIDREAALPDNWLYEFLQELPLEEAQAVAELVLKQALRAAGMRNRDDMTVLVTRFGGGS
jgi:stage II sporulation protein E